MLLTRVTPVFVTSVVAEHSATNKEHKHHHPHYHHFHESGEQSDSSEDSEQWHSRRKHHHKKEDSEHHISEDLRDILGIRSHYECNELLHTLTGNYDEDSAVTYIKNLTGLKDKHKVFEFLMKTRGSRSWKFITHFLRLLDNERPYLSIVVELLKQITNENDVLEAYKALKLLIGHDNFDGVYETMQKISGEKDPFGVADYFRHIAHTNGVDGFKLEILKLTVGEGPSEFPQLLKVLLHEIDMKGAFNLIILGTRTVDIGDAIKSLNKLLKTKSFTNSIKILRTVTRQTQLKYAVEELTQALSRGSLKIIVENLYAIAGIQDLLKVQAVFKNVFGIDNLVTIIHMINKATKSQDGLYILNSLLDITLTTNLGDAADIIQTLTIQRMPMLDILENIRIKSGHENVIDFFKQLMSVTNTKSLQEAWEVIISVTGIKDIFVFFDKIYKYCNVEIIVFLKVLLRVTCTSNVMVAASVLNKITDMDSLFDVVHVIYDITNIDTVKFFQNLITLSKSFNLHESVMRLEDYTETENLIDALRDLRRVTGQSDILNALDYIKENKPRIPKSTTTTAFTTTTPQLTTSTTEDYTQEATEEPATTEEAITTVTEEPTTVEEALAVTTTDEDTTTTTKAKKRMTITTEESTTTKEATITTQELTTTTNITETATDRAMTIEEHTRTKEASMATPTEEQKTIEDVTSKATSEENTSTGKATTLEEPTTITEEPATTDDAIATTVEEAAANEEGTTTTEKSSTITTEEDTMATTIEPSTKKVTKTTTEQFIKTEESTTKEATTIFTHEPNETTITEATSTTPKATTDESTPLGIATMSTKTEVTSMATTTEEETTMTVETPTRTEETGTSTLIDDAKKTSEAATKEATTMAAVEPTISKEAIAEDYTTTKGAPQKVTATTTTEDTAMTFTEEPTTTEVSKQTEETEAVITSDITTAEPVASAEPQSFIATTEIVSTDLNSKSLSETNSDEYESMDTKEKDTQYSEESYQRSTSSEQLTAIAEAPSITTSKGTISEPITVPKTVTDKLVTGKLVPTTTTTEKPITVDSTTTIEKATTSTEEDAITKELTTATAKSTTVIQKSTTTTEQSLITTESSPATTKIINTAIEALSTISEGLIPVTAIRVSTTGLPTTTEIPEYDESCEEQSTEIYEIIPCPPGDHEHEYSDESTERNTMVIATEGPVTATKEPAKVTKIIATTKKPTFTSTEEATTATATEEATTIATTEESTVVTKTERESVTSERTLTTKPQYQRELELSEKSDEQVAIDQKISKESVVASIQVPEKEQISTTSTIEVAITTTTEETEEQTKDQGTEISTDITTKVKQESHSPTKIQENTEQSSVPLKDVTINTKPTAVTEELTTQVLTVITRTGEDSSIVSKQTSKLDEKDIAEQEIFGEQPTTTTEAFKTTKEPTTNEPLSTTIQRDDITTATITEREPDITEHTLTTEQQYQQEFGVQQIASEKNEKVDDWINYSKKSEVDSTEGAVIDKISTKSTEEAEEQTIHQGTETSIDITLKVKQESYSVTKIQENIEQSPELIRGTTYTNPTTVTEEFTTQGLTLITKTGEKDDKDVTGQDFFFFFLTFIYLFYFFTEQPTTKTEAFTTIKELTSEPSTMMAEESTTVTISERKPKTTEQTLTTEPPYQREFELSEISGDRLASGKYEDVEDRINYSRKSEEESTERAVIIKIPTTTTVEAEAQTKDQDSETSITSKVKHESQSLPKIQVNPELSSELINDVFTTKPTTVTEKLTAQVLTVTTRSLKASSNVSEETSKLDDKDFANQGIFNVLLTTTTEAYTTTKQPTTIELTTMTDTEDSSATITEREPETTEPFSTSGSEIPGEQVSTGKYDVVKDGINYSIKIEVESTKNAKISTTIPEEAEEQTIDQGTETITSKVKQDSHSVTKIQDNTEKSSEFIKDTSTTTKPTTVMGESTTKVLTVITRTGEESYIVSEETSKSEDKDGTELEILTERPTTITEAFTITKEPTTSVLSTATTAEESTTINITQRETEITEQSSTTEQQYQQEFGLSEQVASDKYETVEDWKHYSKESEVESKKDTVTENITTTSKIEETSTTRSEEAEEETKDQGTETSIDIISNVNQEFHSLTKIQSYTEKSSELIKDITATTIPTTMTEELTTQVLTLFIGTGEESSTLSEETSKSDEQDSAEQKILSEEPTTTTDAFITSKEPTTSDTTTLIEEPTMVTITEKNPDITEETSTSEPQYQREFELSDIAGEQVASENYEEVENGINYTKKSEAESTDGAVIDKISTTTLEEAEKQTKHRGTEASVDITAKINQESQSLTEILEYSEDSSESTKYVTTTTKPITDTEELITQVLTAINRTGEESSIASEETRNSDEKDFGEQIIFSEQPTTTTDTFITSNEPIASEKAALTEEPTTVTITEKNSETTEETTTLEPQYQREFEWNEISGEQVASKKYKEVENGINYSKKSEVDSTEGDVTDKISPATPEQGEKHTKDQGSKTSIDITSRVKQESDSLTKVQENTEQSTELINDVFTTAKPTLPEELTTQVLTVITRSGEESSIVSEETSKREIFMEQLATTTEAFTTTNESTASESLGTTEEPTMVTTTETKPEITDQTSTTEPQNQREFELSEISGEQVASEKYGESSSWMDETNYSKQSENQIQLTEGAEIDKVSTTTTEEAERQTKDQVTETSIDITSKVPQESYSLTKIQENPEQSSKLIKDITTPTEPTTVMEELTTQVLTVITGSGEESFIISEETSNLDDKYSAEQEIFSEQPTTKIKEPTTIEKKTAIVEGSTTSTEQSTETNYDTTTVEELTAEIDQRNPFTTTEAEPANKSSQILEHITTPEQILITKQPITTAELPATDIAELFTTTQQATSKQLYKTAEETATTAVVKEQHTKDSYKQEKKEIKPEVQDVSKEQHLASEKEDYKEETASKVTVTESSYVATESKVLESAKKKSTANIEDSKQAESPSEVVSVEPRPPGVYTEQTATETDMSNVGGKLGLNHGKKEIMNALETDMNLKLLLIPNGPKGKNCFCTCDSSSSPQIIPLDDPSTEAET